MLSPQRHEDRLTALFVMGALLFSPLVMSIFDVGADRDILGVPLLIVYLFTAWAALIGLLALATRKVSSDDGAQKRSASGKQAPPTTVAQRGEGI